MHGELNRAAGELYKDLLKEKENKLADGPNHKNTTPKRKVTERLKWKTRGSLQSSAQISNFRLATQGAVDCRPPIKVPFALQELVQNNCTRFMANVFFDWRLGDCTEWAERLRNKMMIDSLSSH